MPTIIVARALNDVIGNNGDIPWHLPSDLKRFKELTMGHPVIMGRKTYESLPSQFRPLPGRRNIVLSKEMAVIDGVEVARSLTEAVQLGGEDCFIIGGAKVYRDALSVADRILVTEVLKKFEGDVHFPRLSAGFWVTESVSEVYTENGVDFRYVSYKRRAI